MQSCSNASNVQKPRTDILFLVSLLSCATLLQECKHYMESTSKKLDGHSPTAVCRITRVTLMKIQQIFIISISLLASKVKGPNTLLLADSRRRQNASTLSSVSYLISTPMLILDLRFGNGILHTLEIVR